jgi:nucleotide-binding universal stress UspA family protein
MDINKVLWPTDFSSTAEAALDYVKSLSRDYNAEIHVLHVFEDIIRHEAWYGEFDESHIERLMGKARKRAKERLDQICERHLEGCPLYIKHVAVGDPAAVILNLIEQEKVDLVVMATQGESRNFRFGSVAERVVKNSPIPVTTIPTENPEKTQ